MREQISLLKMFPYGEMPTSAVHRAWIQMENLEQKIEYAWLTSSILWDINCSQLPGRDPTLLDWKVTV